MENVPIDAFPSPFSGEGRGADETPAGSCEFSTSMAPDDAHTLLSVLVEASTQTAATSSRLKKQQQIAGLLRTVSPHEIELAVSYLAGELRQGRTGISFATLQAAT